MVKILHRVVTAFNYIADIITQEGLSKKAGKHLLGATLQGDMIDVFELYSDLDAREIAIKLSSIFDTPLNKAKYLDDLQKFKRRPGENCERAMARLRTTLIGIDQHKRPGERTHDKEIQLRHHLREMVTERIWYETEKEERNSAQEGRTLSIEQMARRCDTKELEQLERNRPDMTISLHTWDLGGGKAPLRNANRFVTRDENRPYNLRSSKTRNQALNTHMDIDTPMDIDPSLDRELLQGANEVEKQPSITDLDSSLDRELIEGANQIEKRPMIEARRKFPLNNDQKNIEQNHEKRNSSEEYHQQGRTNRDTKETWSYSNMKRPNEWDSNKKRGGATGQRFNYSYDRDRQMNQQGNKHEENKQQNQTSTSYQNQNQGSNRSNISRGYNNQYSNYQNRGREYYGKRNFGGQGFRGRGIVKYSEPRPYILYDEICKNQACKLPNSYIHHKDDCNIKMAEEKKIEQGKHQQPTSEQQQHQDF